MQILKDVSLSGRLRPWKEKKEANQLLSVAYEMVDKNKASRLRQCATVLRYLSNESGQKKLDKANFCRVRLCPICQWRRSLKTYSQLRKITEEIEKEELYTYALLTLTIRNCGAEELAETLDSMTKGFKKLSKYVKIKEAVKGWYRGQEITHNLKTDMYHPHYHVLLVLGKRYWREGYIKHAEWVDMWQKAMKLDYRPSVDIRRVKGASSGVLAEISKYMAKESDYIVPCDWEMTVKTVELLDKVLAKRRFSAMGGVMKDWHKRLNLDDMEDGDLVEIDAEKIDKEDLSVYEIYSWKTGYSQYVKVQ